jgi:hypothetical protein
MILAAFLSHPNEVGAVREPPLQSLILAGAIRELPLLSYSGSTLLVSPSFCERDDEHTNRKGETWTESICPTTALGFDG